MASAFAPATPATAQAVFDAAAATSTSAAQSSSYAVRGVSGGEEDVYGGVPSAPTAAAPPATSSPGQASSPTRLPKQVRPPYVAPLQLNKLRSSPIGKRRGQRAPSSEGHHPSHEGAPAHAHAPTSAFAAPGAAAAAAASGSGMADGATHATGTGGEDVDGHRVHHRLRHPDALGPTQAQARAHAQAQASSKAAGGAMVSPIVSVPDTSGPAAASDQPRDTRPYVEVSPRGNAGHDKGSSRMSTTPSRRRHGHKAGRRSPAVTSPASSGSLSSAVPKCLLLPENRKCVCCWVRGRGRRCAPWCLLLWWLFVVVVACGVELWLAVDKVEFALPG